MNSIRPDITKESHFGKCLLTGVVNFNKNNPESGDTDNIGIVMAEQVETIHYPDAQQIVFHMPQYAYDAGTFQITDLDSGATIVKCPLREQLNGGTMILLDTLFLKPGSYNMEADWPNGWTHQVRFIKFKEEFLNPSPVNPPGKVQQAIQNQDLHPPVPEPLRKKVSRIENPATVKNDGYLAPDFGPVVEYTQDGRGGSIFYKESDYNFKFDWEFAAGRGVVIIFIPEERYWEAATKTPLSRRSDILENLARQVIADKAPGCKFEEYDNYINIVRY